MQVCGVTCPRRSNDLLQLRELLRHKTSVLAGPSGVGKSSIINALRFVAMDTAQRKRLAKFEDAMATEHNWRHFDSDEDSGSGSDTPRAGPQPVRTHGAAGLVASNGASELENSHAGAAKRDDERKESRSEQAAWKRRTGDIYGAQVVYHNCRAVAVMASIASANAGSW